MSAVPSQLQVYQVSTLQVVAADEKVRKRDDLVEQDIQLMFEGKKRVVGIFKRVFFQHYPGEDPSL